MSVVRRYTHSAPPRSAASQGNFQLLPNDDAFVGWGAEPYVSEYSQSGRLLYDAHLPTGDEAYRAMRFPWTGTPTSSPALAALGSARTAYVSWNGATEVAAWRLLSGTSPSTLTAVGTQPRTGFETAIPLSGAGPVFEAQALSATGAVLGTSAPEQAQAR
jgi:hypothetical protein